MESNSKVIDYKRQNCNFVTKLNNVTNKRQVNIT